MSEDTFFVEPVVRLWAPSTPDKPNVSIIVGYDGDDLGLVEMRTEDQESKEYFGNLHLSLPPKMARQLGQALIEIAGRMEAK